MLKNNFYATIELGSFEIKILVCNIREERLFVLYQHSVESAGIDKGQITNFDKLVNQIKKLKKLAETDLNHEINSIMLCLPSHNVMVDSVISKINLDVKHPVTSSEVKKILNQVLDQTIEPNYLPINVIPRLFRIDENHIVQNPRGITGMNLSIEASRLSMPTTFVSNLIHAVESAKFKITEIIVGSAAETLSVLQSAEMFARTCHVNIGHLLTTVTVVNDGKILHTHGLPIGSDHVTKAISEAFNLKYETAQYLKESYGALSTDVEQGQDISSKLIYIDNDHTEPNFVTLGMLTSVVNNAYDDIFEVIRQHIDEQIRIRSEEYQYSLSGGGAKITNILSRFYQHFPYPASIYTPSMLGAQNEVLSQIIATSIFAHELTLLIGTRNSDLFLDFNEEPISIINQVKEINVSELVAETKSEYQEEINNQSVEIPETELKNAKNEVISLKERILQEDSLEKQTKKETVIKTQSFQNGEEKSQEAYIDKKLENSGMFVKLFDMIFNESEEL